MLEETWICLGRSCAGVGKKTCGVEQAERVTSGLDATEPLVSKFDRDEETW